MADFKSSLESGLSIAVRSVKPSLRIVSRWLREGARTVVPWVALVVARVATAVLAFWGALLDPDYGRASAQAPARARQSPPPRPAPLPAAAPTTLDKAPPDSALLLLGLLQKDGRLLDFLKEDIAQYSDTEVGAAARVVHQGCRTVLAEYVTIVPVREEAEGSYVTLEPGFDAAAIRPTGRVVGEPPFTGSLVHRGWRATHVRLPQVASGRDLHILAAAEVEL